MKRILVALLLSACNPSAPAPTKTADAPPASTQATPAKAEPRQFGAAFTLTSGEPLAAAIARVGAPAADAKAKDEHTCGDGEKAAEGAKDAAKSVESCSGATGSAGTPRTPGDEAGQKVRVKGNVASVCQRAGCWMVLQDGSSEARIFTREHRFFLPKDIVGKTAEVEGTLRAETLSPKFAKHLAADAAGTPRTPGSGKDPGKGDAPQKEYLMTATAVVITD